MLINANKPTNLLTMTLLPVSLGKWKSNLQDLKLKYSSCSCLNRDSNDYIDRRTKFKFITLPYFAQEQQKLQDFLSCLICKNKQREQKLARKQKPILLQLSSPQSEPERG